MKKLFEWFQYPPVTGKTTIVIIRLIAGAVFFFEGILKFVYANQGVGRMSLDFMISTSKKVYSLSEN